MRIMEKSKIDWCDSTWNPVTGCLHGCEYCYARGIAKRFGGWTDSDGDTYHDTFLMDNSLVRVLDKPLQIMRGEKIGNWAKAPYPYDFQPTLHRYRLNDYIGKKGRNIFVCSMADLFGKWVPENWIDEVFNACEKAPQHNYLFLTKNVERYCKYSVPMADNMWYGTSITREPEMHLFNSLPAFCNIFVSIEPILEDLKLREHNVMFRQVNWVIIGAETGRRKDKVTPERKWIEDIVNECRNAHYPVPVFMKSSLAEVWGEPLIHEYPKGLRKENK